MSIFHESHLDNILFGYLDDNLWNLSRCNKYYHTKIRSMLSESHNNDNLDNLDKIKYTISNISQADDRNTIIILRDSLMSKHSEFVKMCISKIKRQLNFEYIVHKVLKIHIKYDNYDKINYYALEYFIDYLYDECYKSEYVLIKRFISIKYNKLYNHDDIDQINSLKFALSDIEFTLALYVNNIVIVYPRRYWITSLDKTILQNAHKHTDEKGYTQMRNLIKPYI